MYFPQCLSDSQWLVLAPLLPSKNMGCHRLRDIVCAIIYVTKTGCQWRFIPLHFPPWQSVYYHFRRLLSLGILSRMMFRLAALIRRSKGRAEKPTAAIIDSQSVRTGAGVSMLKGWDGAKKLNGRKRHLIVDTLGLPVMIFISGGELSDREGLNKLSLGLQKHYPEIRILWADRSYWGINLTGQIKTAIVQRKDAGSRWKPVISKQPRGFEPIPKRWIVERSFAWITASRRLVRDYEKRPDCSMAFMTIAFIAICMNNLAELS